MTQERAADSAAWRKMHEGEVDIDEALVARLMALQFPQFANLPIRAVPSTGPVWIHTDLLRPNLANTA